jgi:hypothetical protein
MALYHHVNELNFVFATNFFLLFFLRVVSLKSNKRGNVISILLNKKRNVFLFSPSIYYKVPAINCPQALIIGKPNANIFFYILHSVFFDRFAEKYNVNGKEYRTLTKVYGLRFILSIRGEGRRFNIVQLFIAIGMQSFSFLFPINVYFN